MLKTLSVQNYVLIDSLEVSFPEGLIIITGQTGAGKSIILGALSLLMGAKADASVISGGADSCVVEAEFDIPEGSGLTSLLEENDVDSDGGHIIVRRVVNRSGRSRSFVNDSPVNVQLLSRISSHLIDIHSQHQSMLLTDRRFQLSVLDEYAGNGSLLSECRGAYAALKDLQTELEEVNDRLSRLSSERDYNEAQYNELAAARLRDGELEELESEQAQLANAGLIKECLCQVEQLFGTGDDGGVSVAGAVRESEHLLSKAGQFVQDASALAERLSSVRIEIEDILSDVSSLNSGMEVSQSRLDTVEERMSLIYGLFSKHSCKSVAELIDARERYSGMLFDSSAYEQRREELQKSITEAEARLKDICARLHESRQKASEGFSAAICDSLHFLELDRALFAVDLSPAPVSQTGSDSVMFLFSANGLLPADLAKCASGGELSRIMLSLKAMMAKFTDMPTLIFDEIDTGVSGSVADRIGSMICSMGADMQVFAITHLPQVAAKGNAHFLVSKDTDPQTGRTISRIRQITGSERVMEVARMLSGATISDAAVANAEALLS